MSDTRAHLRRVDRAKAKRARLVAPDDYGLQAGWVASLDELDEAKRMLHDALIGHMGGRRIGPVEWRWWEGDEATAKLRVLRDGGIVPEMVDVYRRIGAHLREYGGLFVVAMAPGKRP